MLEILFHSMNLPHPEGIDGIVLTYVQHVCNYLVCRCRFSR
jgi:hypothetical protein